MIRNRLQQKFSNILSQLQKMITYSFGQFQLQVRSPIKILAKNPTLSTQKFFDCCNNSEVEGPQLNQTNVSLTRYKISMKQLKRRKLQSTLNQQSQSRSKSKKTVASNKTSFQNFKNKNHQMVKASQGLPTNYQIEKKQIKMQLSQTRIQEKPTVSTFNTTNYVVGECLVQPQDTKLIFEQNQQINPTIEQQLNTLLNSKVEVSSKTKVKRQHKNKHKLEKNLGQKDLKQLKPYANFSFGQRQKQEYLNKNQDNLSFNRQQPSIQKLRDSKIENKKLEMYQIDSKIEQELNQLSEEQKSKFRGTFQKKSMNHLVGKGGKTINKLQSQHNQPKKSMIIDTLKVVTQKYKQSKESNLVA